ncbi:MAG: hypothetical protein ACRELT_04690, partial [Longimicrobiales bacterium]
MDREVTSGRVSGGPAARVAPPTVSRNDADVSAVDAVTMGVGGRTSDPGVTGSVTDGGDRVGGSVDFRPASSPASCPSQPAFAAAHAIVTITPNPRFHATGLRRRPASSVLRSIPRWHPSRDGPTVLALSPLEFLAAL